MENQLLVGLLIFCRIIAALWVMPIFSATGFPKLVTTLFAFTITLLLYPHFINTPVHEMRTISQLFGGIVHEVVAGLLIGGFVHFSFMVFLIAFDLMGEQMGFNAANLFNPLLNHQGNVLGTVGTWLGTFIFIQSNLHLRCLDVLSQSFDTLPLIGAWNFDFFSLIKMFVETFWTGVQLSGPLLLFSWALHMFTALIGKLSPQMHMFAAIGQVLSVSLGWVVLMFSLSWILYLATGWVAKNLPYGIGG